MRSGAPFLQSQTPCWTWKTVISPVITLSTESPRILAPNERNVQRSQPGHHGIVYSSECHVCFLTFSVNQENIRSFSGKRKINGRSRLWDLCCCRYRCLSDQPNTDIRFHGQRKNTSPADKRTAWKTSSWVQLKSHPNSRWVLHEKHWAVLLHCSNIAFELHFIEILHPRIKTACTCVALMCSLKK